MIHQGGKGLDLIAQQYGIAKAFIVRCDRIGLLHIQRNGAAATLTAADEERLRVVLKATALGFTLPEIKLILDSLDDAGRATP